MHWATNVGYSTSAPLDVPFGAVKSKLSDSWRIALTIARPLTEAWVTARLWPVKLRSPELLASAAERVAPDVHREPDVFWTACSGFEV